MRPNITLLRSMHTKSKLVLRTLKIGWGLRRSVIIGYFTGAVMEVTGTLLTLYATAQLGNLLARYVVGQSADKIWFWLVIDVLAAIVIALGFWLMSFCQRLLYFSMVGWSTNTYMQQLCVIDFPDHYNKEVRNQINKAESGFSWRMAELSSISLELGYGILRFVAITVVIAQISWWLIPVIAIFLLPSLIAEGRMAQLVWFVWDSKGDQRHVFWSLFWIFKQARAQMEIRSQRVARYLTQKVERMNTSFYLSQEQQFRLASKQVVPAKVLEVGGVAIGSVVLIKRFLDGKIGFGQYLFLSGALLRVGGALNAVFATITRLQEPLLYAENFYNLADRPITMQDRPNAKRLKTAAPEIVFDNVSFAYPGAQQSVLRNLHLRIAPGEHIALVGENGAGKSTLIKLLLRFYLPTEGRILINGKDLQNISINSWYDQLATLFQDFNRYPFSIEKNIAMSDETNSERLRDAAQLSDVKNIVKDLPKKYDTILDSSFKEGVEPSGGEYQRIALARAFYRQANFLILDEPTAAIDAKAEYDIFNNIFKHYANKTVLIVSHRFSTVRRADRIIALDNGHIAEKGTHTQLMKNNGLYKEMFTKQAAGYR